MAYTRLHWVESETPLSADNMNNIEDGIEELQSQKVDKVSGKGLSDQNYTAAEKTKLAGIAAGAQVNPGNATTSAAGLMSASDKSKLDGVEAGAQVNPGNATTSAAGLMSASDKTKLNGIEEGATALKCKAYTFTLDANVTVNAGRTASLVFEDFPNWGAIQSIKIRGSGNVALPTIAIIGFYYYGNDFYVDVRNLSTSESVLISSAYTSLRAIRFGNNV